MDNNREIKRLLSKSYLNWYLHVGKHLGTLSKSKAIQIAGVKRLTFNKWLNGKAIVPIPVLTLLRLHSFGHCLQAHRIKYKDKHHFKTLNSNISPVEIQSLFYWRHVLLDELPLINCRRIFKKID